MLLVGKHGNGKMTITDWLKLCLPGIIAGIIILSVLILYYFTGGQRMYP